MWDVILRFAHHPRVGFVSHNNLCGDLLVENIPKDEGIFLRL